MNTTSKWSKRFWNDLGERVVATFIGALLTTFGVTETTRLDWSNGEAVWLLLGVPTAFAFLKGILANLGNPESGASALPAPPGPTVNPYAD